MTKIMKPSIELLIQCRRCGHRQYEYVNDLTDPTYFRCVGCNELSASGAWVVVQFTNDARCYHKGELNEAKKP